METLYGESPEIQMDDGYDANNGIAVYSAGDGNGETITSSDQGGSQVVGAKITWTITRNDDGSITGGISGVDWCPYYNPSDNPFLAYNTQQIWEIASRDRNLNVIFDQFKNPFDFASYVYSNRSQCISGNLWGS